MRSISCLRWFLAGALAASLPVAGQAASGHAMGMGFAGGGSQRPMGGSGRAMGHAFGGRFGHGRFFGHDRFDHGRFFGHDRFDHGRFADHDFFHHHNRFIFVFDFASFGFPWWWGSWWGGYPYPYYGYPYDYGYYDYGPSYGPAYDYQYWRGLAVSVQSELARRGYYHGEVDGMIGSRSRAAIKEFQASKGLPGTGMIDAKLLKVLGIRYRTA